MDPALEEAINKLDDSSISSLKREGELGDLHFGTVIDKLRAIRKIIEALREEPPDELPAGVVTGAAAQVASLDGLLERMRSFTLQEGQPGAERIQIEAEVEAIREWLATNVRPHLRSREVDVGALTAELNTAVKNATGSTKQIEELLAKVRRGAGEAGTGEVSAFHKSQAGKFNDQARTFLIGVGLSVVALGVIGIYVFLINPPPVDTDAPGWEEFLRGMFVRLFFLGLATYALTFCARNYRIARHLQVANEQKAVALDTYPLLIEAIGGDRDDPGVVDAQNIITAEAARSAFGVIDSGFLSEDRERTIIESQSGALAALGALRRS